MRLSHKPYKVRVKYPGAPEMEVYWSKNSSGTSLSRDRGLEPFYDLLVRALQVTEGELCWGFQGDHEQVERFLDDYGIVEEK